MTTDDLSFEEMLDVIGEAQVRFWVCPIDGHSTGGPLRQTVEWVDDVACCLFPGCLRRSDEPGRNSCECEIYDCEGGCCGGRCSCAVGGVTR
jgi:hypothetical protein